MTFCLFSAFVSFMFWKHFSHIFCFSDTLEHIFQKVYQTSFLCALQTTLFKCGPDQKNFKSKHKKKKKPSKHLPKMYIVGCSFGKISKNDNFHEHPNSYGKCQYFHILSLWKSLMGHLNLIFYWKSNYIELISEHQYLSRFEILDRRTGRLWLSSQHLFSILLFH